MKRLVIKSCKLIGNGYRTKFVCFLFVGVQYCQITKLYLCGNWQIRVTKVKKYIYILPSENVGVRGPCGDWWIFQRPPVLVPLKTTLPYTPTCPDPGWNILFFKILILFYFIFFLEGGGGGDGGGGLWFLYIVSLENPSSKHQSPNELPQSLGRLWLVVQMLFWIAEIKNRPE